MAWRRHTRNLTKEVFYDGTTIDGSRLEKALGEIEGGVNSVKKGNTQQRFVATQFHAGFNPLNRLVARGRWHPFPFLSELNSDSILPGLPMVGPAGVFVAGALPGGSAPEGFPVNPRRYKGTSIPQNGPIDMLTQWAWTRMFYFERPVILHGVSVLMHLDLNSTVANDKPLSGSRVNTTPAYTYEGPSPPSGLVAGDGTKDVGIVLDVMNPGTPEDAEMSDVEYTRTNWILNEEKTSLVEPDGSGAGWADFLPLYDTGLMATGTRFISGRLIEHRDLNIPIHERARVRLGVLIPSYVETSSVVVNPGPSTVATSPTTSSWGDDHMFDEANYNNGLSTRLQGWSATITVLEEVQKR